MARRKKLENTSLEEQLEYVEQEIRTKESDLKEPVSYTHLTLPTKLEV